MQVPVCRLETVMNNDKFITKICIRAFVSLAAYTLTQTGRAFGYRGHVQPWHLIAASARPINRRARRGPHRH